MKTYDPSETVDVCIVGSGAGGGPMAWSLANAGASVVVLEKGPWYTEKDFVPDEILECRRDFWRRGVDAEPRVHQWKGSRPMKSVDSWIAACVGGGTVHMSGFVHRLRPDDFHMARTYGGLAGARLADWPFDYAALAPWYDKVESVIGVSGANDNPFEPKRGPYPFEPLAVNPLAGLVEQGAEKAGMRAFTTPRLILSRDKGDRKACHLHPYCGGYGCPTGAKGSTLHSVIPEAVATGRCEVRAGAMVFEIDVKDGRARAVRYLDEAGNPHEQKARVVVLSASAIESARLLLHSGSARGGIANANGLVGKHLTFSTLGKGWGAFDRSKLPDAMKATHPVHFVNRSVQDGYKLAARKGEYDKGGTLNFLLPHRNPIYSAERLSLRDRPRVWGDALMESVRRYYQDVHELEFEVFGEYLPNDDTFVALSKNQNDKWGMPVAEVHIGVHDEDKKNSKLLVDQGIAILEAAGASEVGVDTVGGVTFVLQHGTCRMGTDPATSVLDPTCKSHEIDNLYVVDGSCFPSSGGVPTTLTILANSFRVGSLLAERFTRREIPG
jgi:choline dehydrogenase-like flavoprotein